MAHSRSAVAMLLVVLLVCRYCLAQSGCSPSPPSNLADVPSVISSYDYFWQPSNLLRPQIGSRGTHSWAVFSATQVRMYGLWCQVREQHNAGMGSNIGDWYYPTTGNTSDGFTLLPNTTDDNAPYQSLKCTNQIGLVVVGDVTNNQGIVTCRTTVPNLSREANHFGVYSDNFFNNYTGPIVEKNMTLSLVSSRHFNVMFNLSFNVSYGAPSWIRCTYGNNVEVISSRNPEPRLVREVIRSHYVNISQPDMTRVIVTLTAPREARTYTCNVTVEGRVIKRRIPYDAKGYGTSTASITVAGTPTAVTANKTDLTSVLVSWTAPSPIPAGYEVFFEAVGGSRFSGGNTSNSELTLTGLTPGETYIIFVVAFGAEGTSVLPSAHSNIAMIIIPPLLLRPSTSSIMVSWASPQFTPSSYTVSYSCQLLCGGTQQTSGTATVDGGNTIYTISPLHAGSSCNVSVTAVFGSNSSDTNTSSVNTASAAPTGAPRRFTITAVESRSLTVVWGTVPCSQQRGPITGYRLRYNNDAFFASIIGGENRQHVLTGLTPYTNYSLQVAAVNDGGIGPYSEPALTVETLQETPGPVSNLSASPGVVQLTISWMSPSEPNGFITDYEVGSNSSGGFSYTNTSDTQLTMRNLLPNTIVAFSVRAYTIIGPGDSVFGHVSTNGVPLITSGTVVPLNNPSVNVSWTPLNLSVVSHYTVHYIIVNDSGESGSGAVHFPSTVSSGVVSGLQEGQWYQFSISVTLSISGQLLTGMPVSIQLPIQPSEPLPSISISSELSLTFSQPLQTSIVPMSSETPAPSSPASTYLLTGLVVVSVLFVVSLLGDVIMAVIIIRLVRKLQHLLSGRKAPPGSSHDGVYDQRGQPTKSGDMKMSECVDYDTTPHHQKQESTSDTEYEPMALN